MRSLFIYLCGLTAEIKFAHRLIDTRVYYVCCCFYMEILNLYQVQSDITHDEIRYLHVSSYFIKTSGAYTQNLV